MSVLTVSRQKLLIWARRLKRRVRPRRQNAVLTRNRPDPATIPAHFRREVRAVLSAPVPYMLLHTTAGDAQVNRNVLEALRTLRDGSRCRLVVVGTLAQQWKTALKTARMTVRDLPRLTTPLPDLSPEEGKVIAQQAVALFLPPLADDISETLRANVPRNVQGILANTAENRTRYRDAVAYYDPADAQSIAYALRRVMDALTYNDIGASPMQAPTPVAGASPSKNALAAVPTDSPPPVYDARLPLYFLHIPKAAGTSVRLLLEDQYPHSEVCSAYYPAHLGAIPPERLPQFRLYRGHLAATLYPLLNTPVNTFTWLRDPLDWLLSDFAFRMQEHVIPQSMTLDEWLEVLAPDPICHFLTLGAEFAAEQDNLPLVEKAKTVLQKCFLIGLVGRHEDSINLLCYHLGIYPPEAGVALNRSRSRTQWDDYPAETKKRAEALLQGDRELYAWAEPRFAAQRREMTEALRPEITARFGATANPTTEQVREILRERFFRRQEQETPLLEEIDTTFDQPLIGEGWDERPPAESVGPFGYARGISGDACRAVIYLPIRRERPCLLRFGISEIYAPKAVAGMRLEVNGVPIPLERDSYAHPRLLSEVVLRARIPAEALQAARPLTKLVFTTDTAIRQADTDPFLRDASKRTVALNWISIRPIR